MDAPVNLRLLLRIALVATLLTLTSCAQRLPPRPTPAVPPVAALQSTLCPKPETTPATDAPKRYLDRMAIIDARKDFSQAPEPGYVLDANSVVRFPRIEPIGVIMIGDSIITGWSGYFAKVFPNAFIDGRVGRQFSAILPIWQTLQQCHTTSGVRDVVVELGTNGEVSPQDMQEFLQMAGNRQIYLVVPEMPRSWEHEVQQLYIQTAAEHPNVHLVRWDLLSANHPSYYWTDRVHPNWQGIQVMVQAIAQALAAHNS
ncbi:MAG: acyltransferase [Candidatus Igneacidithiobacillus chanchocoensis]